MFWTLLAMLLLVGTGGFISYYGDLQGRRWGKKRVSWFGMRPKHTAILITSLTGAVIALLSVAALMLVVPNVRNVVLRGEAAINDYQRFRKQKKKEIEALQVQLKAMAAQMATTQAANDETNKLAARAKLDMAALERTNVGLEKLNGGLVSGNMDLQRKSASLHRSIQKNQQELAQQKKDIANATIINTELGSQNTSLGRENENLSRERTRLLAANGSLKEANEKLKEDNAKLATDNAQLKMNYTAANNAYTGLLDDMKELQDKQDGLKTAYAQLKGQFEDLTQHCDELSNELAGTSRDFVRAYLQLSPDAIQSARGHGVGAPDGGCASQFKGGKRGADGAPEGCERPGPTVWRRRRREWPRCRHRQEACSHSGQRPGGR